MKKVFVFLLVSSLLFSFVCIGISASDPLADLTNTEWVFSNSPTSTSSVTLVVDFVSNGQTFSALSVSSSVVYRFLLNDSWITVFDGSTWIDDDYKTILITGGSDSHNQQKIPIFMGYYDFVGYTDLSAGNGVRSAINFSGQVLSFISSTEGILSLVGLSIALFLIVPFSIRKLKGFVKGY